MKLKHTRGILASIALLMCTCSARAQIISTVAGNGTPTFGGDGFAATLAQINNPRGVAFDASGNMYIADCDNHRIRKVDAAGNISTYAGNGTAGALGNGGPATAAQLTVPYALAFDHAGNLYVADMTNNSVRKITPAGTIFAFAGIGGSGYSGDGGPATAAQISGPSGVSIDAADNVYIASPGNNCVRKVTPAGIITTIAGNGTLGSSGDGGPATAAMLAAPHAIGIDAAGNIYIADQFNLRVRKVNAAGIISTVAGTGTGTYSGDGGPATAADILNPTSVSFDGAGNMYIASYNAHVIRMVDGAGVIHTFAGMVFNAGYNGDGGLADTSELNHPYCVTAAPDGNIYIADQLNNRIRKIVTPPCSTVNAGSILSTNGNAFCATDSTMLTINGVNTGSGITYQWQSSPDGITWANVGTTYGYQTSMIGSAAIQYRAIATCAAATMSDTTPAYIVTPVATVLPTIIVTATPSTVVAAGTIVTFNAAITNGGTSPSLQWLRNGAPIAGAVNNPFVTNALINGDTITCIVYSSAPCANPDSAISAGSIMSVGVGVENSAWSHSFIISPNPNTGTFHISGNVNNTSAMQVQVLNMLGQVIYNSTIAAKNNHVDTEVSLPSSSPNGMYIVTIQTGEGIIAQHLSLQH